MSCNKTPPLLLPTCKECKVSVSFWNPRASLRRSQEAEVSETAGNFPPPGPGQRVQSAKRSYAAMRSCTPPGHNPQVLLVRWTTGVKAAPHAPETTLQTHESSRAAWHTLLPPGKPPVFCTRVEESRYHRPSSTSEAEDASNRTN